MLQMYQNNTHVTGANGTAKPIKHEMNGQMYTSHLDSVNHVSLIEKIASYDQPFFSIEFFPPRTIKCASNFVQLLDKFAEGNPLFCDITWHASSSATSIINPSLDQSNKISTSSIKMADVALNYCCLETMLHITCIGMTKDHLRQHLEHAKRLGIRNILALRGDKQVDSQVCDFQFAADLVRFIRKEYGAYFTIVVAGYPIPHSESQNKEHDLRCLKEKVDAGADAIITQLFFELDDYVQFVHNCHRIGISVPIIPGICSINSFQSLVKFAKLSAVPVPEKMLQDLNSIKDNEQAVRNYGIYFLTHLCHQLIQSNLAPGLHFFTLNQDTVIPLLKTLGLWKKVEITFLPWRPCTNHRRLTESTRPVFWANRPKSYLYKTSHWQDYPCSFWSDKFGFQIADSLEDMYSFLEVPSYKNELDQFLLVEHVTFDNVSEVFYAFYAKYSTNNVKRISNLPWVQQPKINFIETVFPYYGQLILRGALITNYLPCIDGEHHSKAKRLLSGRGGGEPQDYTTYQKEYIEFFMEPSLMPKLESLIKGNQLVSYHISDRSGKIQLTNWPSDNHIIIAWRVFSNHQQQLVPVYVADLESFNKWRIECYDLFTCWLKLYEPQHDAHLLIEYIQNNHLQVSLIENQFVSTESCLRSILNQLFTY